ncbi:MAG: hypothetical protein ACYC06_00985 [Ilumatobacteraceae bacterium]
MTIDEQVRHDLFTGLQAAVGLEPAKLMMTAIPSFSWSEVATKADLAQFATRDEMHAEFAKVRSEFHADSAAIRLEIANLSNRMLAQMNKSHLNLFFQIAMFNISTAGMILAALHYLL